MNIAVLCEYSGRVRDAFLKQGHEAISCDYLPSESTFGTHYQGDAREMLKYDWDLVIAFPPCTDLAASNAHNLKIKEVDGRMAAAAEFFVACYNAKAPRVCVENPVGVMSRLFRKPDQIINPWWFGDPWNKKTCLWLRGLPPLVATHKLEDYDPAPRPWHHGSGIRREGVRKFDGQGCANSAKMRSLTFQGVANAMAEQWSDV